LEEKKITAAWLNEISREERTAVWQGSFGKKVREWAKSYFSHFVWHSPNTATDVNNGSCFFVRSGERLFMVTADHVYDQFVQDKKKSSTSLACRIGHVDFDPDARLIDRNPDLDLATFQFKYEELIGAEKQAIDATNWPPPEPIEGNIAFFGGFPARGRVRVGEKVGFGRYLGLQPITVVNDRQIVVRFRREDWIEVDGMGLPPPGLDLGGMSGGPILLPLDDGNGVWHLFLGGTITQASSSPDLEAVVAIRAHFINPDGSISRV
jgi:hypothetical protein